MRVVRVEETPFRRRPFGVLEDWLADKDHGHWRKRLLNNLGPEECVALVSVNGMNVIFLRGFDKVTADDGSEHVGLSYYAIQLDRPWTLELLQYFVKKARLPFQVTNYKSFEEIFPKAAKAAKAFVRRAA